MENLIGRLLVGIMSIGVGLYFLWQIAERLDHYMIRRRRAKEGGHQSICRWGINSDGEITHIRTKVVAREPIAPEYPARPDSV